MNEIEIEKIRKALALGCVFSVEDRRPVFRDARSALATLEARAREPSADVGDNHGLDTDESVFFYEQDFYVLSNFSAFTLRWRGQRFDTSEAAYHYEKFVGLSVFVQELIINAASAHEAFKIAEIQKSLRRPDWDLVKVDIMRDILRAKVSQHEYVKRKLLATGSRTLIENSWRDSFWGWGADRKGENMLGRLWMEIRQELVGENTATPHQAHREPSDDECAQISNLYLDALKIGSETFNVAKGRAMFNAVKKWQEGLK